MRKLIPLLLVAVLGMAVSAQAQAETYSLNASAGNVTTLTDVISFFNAQACQQLALAPACTQAQACTAASAPGGASCTAAQARGANVRIWPLTLAGREEYTTFQIALPRFQDLVGSVSNAKRQTFASAWAGLSQASRDSICTTLALPAGCSP